MVTGDEADLDQIAEKTVGQFRSADNRGPPAVGLPPILAVR
jgi:hypothetical protein